MAARINLEKFVDEYLKVYKDGGTIGDLANWLKEPKQRVSARKSYLKKKGVMLPPLAGGQITYNRELIDKLNGKVERALKELNG